MTHAAGVRNRASSSRGPSGALDADERAATIRVPGLPGVTLARWAREGMRRLKRTPERIWHPLRRAAALRSLRHGGVPRSVLFVCHGNICRSPFAAVAFRRAVDAAGGPHVRVASAGFVGPGRACPDHGLSVAAACGLDLSTHRSQLPTPTLVAASDLIVVMEERQRWAFRTLFGRDTLVLGDLDPEPIETRGIEDPWDRPRAAFERSYARIQRCLDQLVAAVRWAPESVPGATPEASRRDTTA